MPSCSVASMQLPMTRTAGSLILVLLWAGIFALGSTRIAVPRQAAFAGIGAGALMVVVATAGLGASITMVAAVAVMLAAGFGTYQSLPYFRAWLATRATS